MWAFVNHTHAHIIYNVFFVVVVVGVGGGGSGGCGGSGGVVVVLHLSYGYSTFVIPY